MSVRVLVPSGVLGLGFDRKALARGVALKPDVICIDGGSTDSGPHSLGTGTSKYSRAACKAEWRDLMLAREQAKVPLIIGSAGTCGSDATVDWMCDITRELAKELGHSVNIVNLYTEQDQSDIATALSEQRIRPLEPELPLTDAVIRQCTHIVALAGAEHIQAALACGADIVIAGRTTDTAIISALPLTRGCSAGAAWHAAKIAECGALCSTHPTSGVIVVDIDEHPTLTDSANPESDSVNANDGFTIYPLAEGARCTPHSVSAHMLYENTDPFVLYEPGGYLDVSHAQYKAVNDSTVRVTGSQWTTTTPYTMKLEGARLVGYQTTMLALLRDAHYVANAKAWVARLTHFLHQEIASSLSLGEDEYTLEFRLIGVNAVLGELETEVAAGFETGVLVIITAQNQALADEMGKLINPFLLHYPLSDEESLPTFAFPYSPAQTSRGALYEFCLNHVLEVNEPMRVVRMETLS